MASSRNPAHFSRVRDLAYNFTPVFVHLADSRRMKTITATVARRRFGALLKDVQNGPILIRRKNRDESVIMSAEEYERIRSKGPRPRSMKP
jgi:prevent-host-death family protein